MLMRVKSLLIVGTSFCHIPLGPSVNLCITGTSGQDSVFVSLLGHCHFHGMKFHFLRYVCLNHSPKTIPELCPPSLCSHA